MRSTQHIFSPRKPPQILLNKTHKKKKKILPLNNDLIKHEKNTLKIPFNQKNQVGPSWAPPPSPQRSGRCHRWSPGRADSSAGFGVADERPGYRKHRAPAGCWFFGQKQMGLIFFTWLGLDEGLHVLFYMLFYMFCFAWFSFTTWFYTE